MNVVLNEDDVKQYKAQGLNERVIVTKAMEVCETKAKEENDNEFFLTQDLSES